MAEPQTVPSPPDVSEFNPPTPFVPGAPDVAPAQTVFAYVKDEKTGKTNRVKIPVEEYLYSHKNFGTQLAIPATSKDGQPSYIPANEWKEAEKNGYKFRTDSLQVPATIKLIKLLNEKNQTSGMDFFDEWINAAKSMVPESIKKAYDEKRGTSLKENLQLNWEESPPGQTLSYLEGAWKGIQQAAKSDSGLPDKAQFAVTPFGTTLSGETLSKAKRSAEGLASIIPFAPSIARGVDLLSEHWFEDDPGETHVAAGLGSLSFPVVAVAAPEIAKGLVESWRGVQRNVPLIPKSEMTKRAYNTGVQGIVSSLVRELPEGDVADRFRDVAGAQRKGARLAEFDRVQALKKANDLDGLDREIERIGKSLDQDKEKLETEQARRVATMQDFHAYANQVMPDGVGDPYQMATQAIEALQGHKGFVDSVKRPLYDAAYQRLEQEGVRPALTETLHELERSMGLPARTQAQMGTSTLTPSDLIALQKMREHVAGVTGEFPLPQREAIDGVVDGIAEGRAVQVPFGVANEAKQGIGKMIRKLQANQNPENATRIRVLTAIQDGLKRDLSDSLVNHSEAEELLNAADRITAEQHDVTDRRVIRGFYGNERYRWTADTLTQWLLKPRKREFHDTIVRGLTLGPEAEAGVSMARSVMTEEQAATMARNLHDMTERDAAAKQGLARSVVDEMLRVGRNPSTVPGVQAPSMDFNKMASFLRDRPGARILLGDRYEPLLAEADRQAATQLHSQDPELYTAVQRIAAKREVLDLRTQKAAAARSLIEAEDQKIKAPAAAEKFKEPMSMSEFANRIIDNPGFRDWVAAEATPAEKLKICRGIIQEVLDNSMEGQGEIGQPDAILDLQRYASQMGDAAPALRKFGSPTAVNKLVAIARLAERAKVSAGTGIIGRIYGWGQLGPRIPGLPEARMSFGVKSGPFTLGPAELAREVRSFEMPVDIPEGVRKFSNDVFLAAQDPALAEMMRRAMKMKPLQPGAGTFTVQYLLAFESAKQGPREKRKELDDKDAQGFLRESGGDIEKAVFLAQQRGY